MDIIENLRTFVTVASTGSLAAAARHLEVPRERALSLIGEWTEVLTGRPEPTTH